MSTDYALNAQLRVIFVQRWVDLSCLEYGVTNGVVYLKGTLRPHMTRNTIRGSERDHDDEIDLVRSLERTLRQVRGVRDIVFQLTNLRKSGSKWFHR